MAALSVQARTPFDDGRLRRKALALLALYGSTYAALLLVPGPPLLHLALALAWGFCQALIAFNLPHDASHGAISPDPATNRRYNAAFRLAGLEPYTWHLKHDLAHHGFTNVPGLDPDLEAWPILRYSPADRRLWFHRFQHLYAPLAYLALGLFFVLWIDFRLLFDRRFRDRFGVTHPRHALLSLLATKAFYLLIALVIPSLVLPYAPGTIALGLLATLALVGLVSAMVLLPSHCMMHARFLPDPHQHPVPRDDAAAAAVSTTLDFAPESRLANWLLGGFNTNAIHHLFPDICHVHYRALTPVFAATCAEFGVPYRRASLLGAIASHFAFLRHMGRADAAPDPHAP